MYESPYVYESEFIPQTDIRPMGLRGHSFRSTDEYSPHVFEKVMFGTDIHQWPKFRARPRANICAICLRECRPSSTKSLPYVRRICSARMLKYQCKKRGNRIWLSGARTTVNSTNSESRPGPDRYFSWLVLYVPDRLVPWYVVYTYEVHT